MAVNDRIQQRTAEIADLDATDPALESMASIAAYTAVDQVVPSRASRSRSTRCRSSKRRRFSGDR
jgi:hypothetical protein